MPVKVSSVFLFTAMLVIPINVFAWDFSVVQEDCCEMCMASQSNTDGSELSIRIPINISKEHASPFIFVNQYYSELEYPFSIRLFVDGNLVSVLKGATEDLLGGTSAEIATKELDRIARGNLLRIVISDRGSFTFSLKGSASAVKRLSTCAGMENISRKPTVISETVLKERNIFNCHSLDLRNWQHPTKQVLESLDASIVEVNLCNDDKYPIFQVALPVDLIYHSHDPVTSKYVGRLWRGMMKANGYWPFALLDVERQDVFFVTPEYSDEHKEYFANLDSLSLANDN